MHLFEDFKVRDGLSVHLWPTRKFRTSYLQIYLHCPLNDETATFFNLLPAVLTRGTREHPETIDLNKRLDMLYGASLSSTFSRRGERGLVAFTANMPDISCEGREPLEHLAKLLSDVMFRPALDKDGLLRHDYLSQERAGIINDIASIRDDKDAWAEYRCVANMCKDEPYSVHTYGDEELLRSIGAEPLTSWWSNVMPKLRADIFAVGDFEALEALEIITGAFGGSMVPSADPGLAASIVGAPNAPRIIEEAADTMQAKLVIGWRGASRWADDDYAQHALANHIFGQFPQSKLFMNIREKEGLAYSVGSKLEPTKGLIFAFAGVEPSKAVRAAGLMLAQQAAMAEGDITEKEISDAKKSLVTGIRMAADSPPSMYSREMTGIVNGRRLGLEEACQRIMDCTAGEVAKAASSWKPDTIFKLMPTGAERGGRP